MMNMQKIAGVIVASMIVIEERKERRGKPEPIKAEQSD